MLLRHTDCHDTGSDESTLEPGAAEVMAFMARGAATSLMTHPSTNLKMGVVAIERHHVMIT